MLKREKIPSRLIQPGLVRGRLTQSVKHLNSEETQALRELARPSLTPSKISDEVLKRLIKLGYAVKTRAGPEATQLGKAYLLPPQRT